MPSKVKVTVSIDEKLLRELAGTRRRGGKPRSQIVEEALRLWKRRQRDQALREGYQAMAAADRTTAEQRLRAGWEAIG